MEDNLQERVLKQQYEEYQDTLDPSHTYAKNNIQPEKNEKEVRIFNDNDSQISNEQPLSISKGPKSPAKPNINQSTFNPTKKSISSKNVKDFNPTSMQDRAGS
jgi:primase-polymerase (primpol)-like protein